MLCGIIQNNFSSIGTHMSLFSFIICLITCYICFSYPCCCNFYSLSNDAYHIVLFSHKILTSVSKCYYSFLFLCYFYFILFVYIPLHFIPPFPPVAYVISVAVLSFFMFTYKFKSLDYLAVYMCVTNCEAYING